MSHVPGTVWDMTFNMTKSYGCTLHFFSTMSVIERMPLLFAFDRSSVNSQGYYII